MELVRYNQAKRALELAKSVDEVKEIRDKAEAIRAYAKQAKDRQMETDAAEIRMRAQRRLGEQLVEQKEAGEMNKGAAEIGVGKRGNQAEPRCDASPTLADMGITKRLSSESQQLAAIPADEFEERITEWREDIELEGKPVTVTLPPKSNGAHVGKATGMPEWYTPPEYLDAARELFGSIELDPASSDIAQETVRAAQYYTVETDGLAHRWQAETVWMNPPYTVGLIDQFVAKLLEHLAADEITSAVVLVNNATETQWFQSALAEAAAVCFPRARIKFVSPDGEQGSPLQGQALLYFGSNRAGFAAIFGRFGAVLYGQG